MGEHDNRWAGGPTTDLRHRGTANQHLLRLAARGQGQEPGTCRAAVLQPRRARVCACWRASRHRSPRSRVRVPPHQRKLPPRSRRTFTAAERQHRATLVRPRTTPITPNFRVDPRVKNRGRSRGSVLSRTLRTQSAASLQSVDTGSASTLPRAHTMHGTAPARHQQQRPEGPPSPAAQQHMSRRGASSARSTHPTPPPELEPTVAADDDDGGRPSSPPAGGDAAAAAPTDADVGAKAAPGDDTHTDGGLSQVPDTGRASRGDREWAHDAQASGFDLADEPMSPAHAPQYHQPPPATPVRQRRPPGSREDDARRLADWVPTSAIPPRHSPSVT